MHIIKPLWLSHSGELRDHEVYSCHVSPDGSRLVTAARDAHVRIWSTDAIFHSVDEEYTKPKQLAALSTHSGTIHAVRFSNNNKYLASGADDKIVCVYTLDPNPPTHSHAFGSHDPPPVENWRVFRRLVGHDNDVQDLGWSYDSSILVSVGLDSKVVVWSGHTFEKLKTLSQHQSHVKGITFDPANKYFATASDDRTIKLFRFTSPLPNATAQDQVNNFILETTISAPFISSPLTTYFRRCSWSPDGNHIAAANAVNGPVSSVAIVNRGSWDSDINLIGHEGPVEVCAFSPRMFYKDPPTPSNSNLQASVTVVACAGQDKTLSVWNTSYARPFVITQELASKSISDIAWAPDGEKLYLTSLDGGIMAVSFEPGELGYAAPLQENEKALTKFGAGRKAGIVEGTDALVLEELSKAGELKEVQGRMGELMGDGAAQPAPVPPVVTVNGTRTNGTAASTIAPPTTNGASPTASTATPQPTQQEIKVTQLKQRVEIVDGKKRVKPLLISSSSAAPSSSLPQTQLITNTTQGVKPPSDAPHSIIDLSKPYDGLPKGGLAALLIGNKRKFADIEGDDERRTEKRLTGAVQDGAAPIVLNGVDGLVPPSATAVQNTSVPSVVDPALTVSQIRLATPVLRSVIVRTSDASVPPASGTTELAGAEDVVILEARNATSHSRTGRAQDRDPTRMNCTKQGQSLWQDYLPKPVTLLTGNAHFWAAGCDDGSIHVWTPAGRRLISPLILAAQPVILDCRGWWLLAISAVGMCHIWNIKTLTAAHPPVSLGPVLDITVHSQGPHLTLSPGIVFARLNSQGRVIVAMTNGDGYTYSPSLYVWQRLSEPWWAVGSQYWNTADSSVNSLQSSGSAATSNGNGTSNGASQATFQDSNLSLAPENISAGIIPLLERNTTTHALLRGRAYFLQRLIKALLVAEGFEGFEANVSVAHLENRVAAAMAMGAREEFKVYLMMYAKRLGAEGLKAKIEELLRSLLGRIFEDDEEAAKAAASGQNGDADDADGWNGSSKELCGWPRSELLKDVVLILGKHRDLQRLMVPYARLLNVLDKRPEDGVPNVDVMTDV